MAQMLRWKAKLNMLALSKMQMGKQPKHAVNLMPPAKYSLPEKENTHGYFCNL